MTKRTKNLKKQDIPSLDDPISKLNHIGKETVKKLNELKLSADEAQLELPISMDLFRCVITRVWVLPSVGLNVDNLTLCARLEWLSFWRTVMRSCISSSAATNAMHKAELSRSECWEGVSQHSI